MFNPFLYVDPSGYTWFSKLGNWFRNNWESIVTTVVTVAVGVAVGAAVVASCGTAAPLLVAVCAGTAAGFAGGVTSGILSGQDLGGVMKSGLIGAGTGLVSGALGGVASAVAPAGALWGSLYGAGTGAVIGGVGSAMTGGDIKEGIIFGAATGLVGGGFQGYCSAKSQGLNPWTGSKLPETTVNTPNVMSETPKEMAPKETETTGEYGVSFNDKIQNKVPCPDGWKVVESNKKGGIKYIDPANPKGNNIRIMPGNPNSPNPVQKGPYVKWFINGKFYDVHGNCLGNNNTILESHIPLDDLNLNVMPRK